MKPRLLVVDDEPMNLEIIAEYLDGSGVEHDPASGGEEAWRLLEEHPARYDLIVLDRMMPGLDGMALLRRIKADERFKHLPVVMQTAAASTEQVREGLQAGAYYYLIKPFHADTLLLIIRAALGDRDRWLDVAARIANHGMALSCMTEASFSIGNLEEAHALAALLALASDNAEAVGLGLAELLVNGVEHGNLGIDFATKAALKRSDSWDDEVQRRMQLAENRGKRVQLQLRRDGHEWDALIRDEGVGFHWHDFLEIDPARAFEPNGRGIALSRQMSFSSMEYQGCGNTVAVRFAVLPRTLNNQGLLE